MSTNTRDTARGTGFLATLSLAIGLMGVAATGCGLDTTTGIEPRDCIPTEEGLPEDCPDEQPVESVVPIGTVGVELEGPSR